MPEMLIIDPWKHDLARYFQKLLVFTSIDLKFNAHLYTEISVWDVL